MPFDSEVTAREGTVRYSEMVGGSVKKSEEAASTLFAVYADNSLNTAASYLKLYNSLTADVTVGTTAPDMAFRIPAGETLTQHISPGVGYAFTTGLTAVVVIAGGTGNTVAPTSAVKVTLYTN